MVYKTGLLIILSAFLLNAQIMLNPKRATTLGGGGSPPASAYDYCTYNLVARWNDSTLTNGTVTSWDDYWSGTYDLTKVGAGTMTKTDTGIVVTPNAGWNYSSTINLGGSYSIGAVFVLRDTAGATGNVQLIFDVKEQDDSSQIEISTYLVGGNVNYLNITGRQYSGGSLDGSQLKYTRQLLDSTIYVVATYDSATNVVTGYFNGSAVSEIVSGTNAQPNTGGIRAGSNTTFEYFVSSGFTFRLLEWYDYVLPADSVLKNWNSNSVQSKYD